MKAYLAHLVTRLFQAQNDAALIVGWPGADAYVHRDMRSA